MPLMRDWTEITVDEGLLSQVVRELLQLTDDPNHVEVVYGTTGRVILADVDLAERWFQAATKKQEDETETNIEVVGHGLEVVANEEVDVADSPTATSEVAEKDPGPLPVKRGPGRPRKTPLPFSASDGEEP